jgi:hypothetical protein
MCCRESKIVQYGVQFHSPRGRGRRRNTEVGFKSVFGWFTEGFDTADLKEAKELLDELT